MAHHTFVAFASADPVVADTIVGACEAARFGDHDFTPWNRNDASGQPIDRSVYGWVDQADALVADISTPNHNVTYEVALALGSQKPVRLIRAANKDRKLLEEIGLLHNIGHDDFSGRDQLAAILRRPITAPAWPCPKRNLVKPVYLLQSSLVDGLLRRCMSAIKKILRLQFRSFNPREIDRLEVRPQVSQQPDHFEIAMGLRLQPAARSHPVQISVNVELQKVARRIARTTGRLRHDTGKPGGGKVKPFNKRVDEPYRIVRGDVIVNRLRQQ